MLFIDILFSVLISGEKKIKVVKSKQIYEQNHFILIVGGKSRQDKKVQTCCTKIVYKCQQAK